MLAKVRQITRWDDERGSPTYAHADQHALLMPAAAPGLVYDPDDGGLDVSEDGGTRWTNRSNGLVVTMYYELDAAQSDACVYGGGCQDNGTLVTTNGRPNDHFELLVMERERGEPRAAGTLDLPTRHEPDGCQRVSC